MPASTSTKHVKYTHLLLAPTATCTDTSSGSGRLLLRLEQLAHGSQLQREGVCAAADLRLPLDHVPTATRGALVLVKGLQQLSTHHTHINQ